MKFEELEKEILETVTSKEELERELLKGVRPKTKLKQEQFPFFVDPEENENFNKDFWKCCERSDKDEVRVMKNLILGYRKQVPLWDYPTARAILNISKMEVLHAKFLESIDKGLQRITRNDTETLSRNMTAIEKSKELIGIDPKSLASAQKGSLNESFAEIVSRIEFKKERFVCKPIFGIKLNTEDITTNEFSDLSEKELDEYLHTAGKE